MLFPSIYKSLRAATKIKLTTGEVFSADYHAQITFVLLLSLLMSSCTSRSEGILLKLSKIQL